MRRNLAATPGAALQRDPAGEPRKPVMTEPRGLETAAVISELLAGPPPELSAPPEAAEMARIPGIAASPAPPALASITPVKMEAARPRQARVRTKGRSQAASASPDAPAAGSRENPASNQKRLIAVQSSRVSFYTPYAGSAWPRLL